MADKSDPIAVIQRLGWDWRQDGLGLGLGPGVVLTVRVSGRNLRTFVPLAHVFAAFDQELEAVGCATMASVGAPYSVGGLFSSISHAFSSVTKAIVPKVIRNAASSVVNVAKSAGNAALHAVNKIPVIGTVAHAAESLALLPAQAAQQLVAGKRIDQIALGQFKGALGAAKEVAPYVATVVSFVPGVGTGIAAGIGAATALAQGKSISDAMMAAAKNAIPGGPAAKAAFSVASDAMQGKRIDTIAIDAIGSAISPSAKQALVTGLNAAKDLAAGKPVSQVVIDNAIAQLPPAYQKAVQVGVAMGHAKNLQGAAGAAVQGAAQLAGAAAQGAVAQQHFAAGLRTPQVMQALHTAQVAHNTLAEIVAHAQQGHPQANNIVNALKLLPRPPALPAHMPTLFRPPWATA